MKRIGFLLTVIGLSFTGPVVAQELDLSVSRWDILTAKRSWAGIDSCSYLCEWGSHTVTGSALYYFADDLLDLVPGIDDKESKLLGTGLTLGFAVGRETIPFLDTFYDDAADPGARRVNHIAQALEQTLMPFGDLGAEVWEDLPGGRLLGRFLGITANIALQRQLLPHRGLVPLSAPIVVNP